MCTLLLEKDQLPKIRLPCHRARHLAETTRVSAQSTSASGSLTLSEQSMALHGLKRSASEYYLLLEVLAEANGDEHSSVFARYALMVISYT